jgi:hypothetical protein
MRSPEVDNKSDNQMYFTAIDDRSEAQSPTDAGPLLGVSSLSQERHRHSEVAFTGVLPSPILSNGVKETELVNRQLEFKQDKDLNTTLDLDEEG